MNKWFKAFNSPKQCFADVLSLVSPLTFWRLYRERAKAQGFDKLYFSFSFDCDTTEDAKVVLEVDARMRSLGVVAAYAVPSEVLEKNRACYETLALKGAEFLNHGYTTHTVWDNSKQRYQSIFFYDEVSQNSVRDDIIQGHEYLRNFLGAPPKGFRTPHFGTFQAHWDLKYLHLTLSQLGYSYSSSTVPTYSIWNGPLSISNSIYEIPLSGIADRPRQIFDSWGFFAAPNRQWTSRDYVLQAKNMAKLAVDLELVGILNYYADPSQVHDQESFYEGIECLTKISHPIGLDEITKLNSELPIRSI